MAATRKIPSIVDPEQTVDKDHPLLSILYRADKGSTVIVEGTSLSGRTSTIQEYGVQLLPHDMKQWKIVELPKPEKEKLSGSNYLSFPIDLESRNNLFKYISEGMNEIYTMDLDDDMESDSDDEDEKNKSLLSKSSSTLFAKPKYTLEQMIHRQLEKIHAEFFESIADNFRDVVGHELKFPKNIPMFKAAADLIEVTPATPSMQRRA